MTNRNGTEQKSEEGGIMGKWGPKDVLRKRCVQEGGGASIPFLCCRKETSHFCCHLDITGTCMMDAQNGKGGFGNL